MNELRETIKKYDLFFVNENKLGCRNKPKTQKEFNFIKENKYNLLKEILKIKEEKELEELQEIENEKQEILKGKKFTIGMQFYCGKSIWGLPKFLESKEKILLEANDKDLFSFPMGWDGYDNMEVDYNESTITFAKG